MDARDWNDRYAASERVWSGEPNVWVAQIAEQLPPGRALDVAAGEGRNAIWLASRGWTVVATDFSDVAIARARRLAEESLGERADQVTTLVADALQPPPDAGPYDLVLYSYLQLPAAERLVAWRHGIASTAPGGRMLIVGHAGRNLDGGWGGPQDRAVLYDPEEVTAALAHEPVHVELAELRSRPVETEDGLQTALDTVVVLCRR